MEREEKQKLIDLMFEMVLVSTADPIFCKRPRGERMAWVANNLRSMGYDTHPIGMSWSALVSPDFRKDHPIIEKDLDKNI